MHATDYSLFEHSSWYSQVCETAQVWLNANIMLVLRGNKIKRKGNFQNFKSCLVHNSSCKLCFLGEVAIADVY